MEACRDKINEMVGETRLDVGAASLCNKAIGKLGDGQASCARLL